MEERYSQDKFNATSYRAVAVVFVSLQAFAGLWINAFIICVLVIAWVKKKSLNSNEKILLFLGCSRFWYFCFAWAGTIILIYYHCLIYIHPLSQILDTIYNFLYFSNMWVSCCLSIFYCIKIANFQHSFFTFLKARIDRMVPWMLMSSLLLSLTISNLVYKFTDAVSCNNPNGTSLGIYWKINVKMDANVFPAFLITGFGFATAFLAVSFSALLLLFSLWRHKCRMQENSVSNVSVDAHIKAMKSILSFFFLYSINFTCSVLELIYLSKMEDPESLLILVLQHVFPLLHSLVLIFSNPKLEKTLMRTLLCGKRKVSKG